jgi:para-aminobenzoate synthetase component I
MANDLTHPFYLYFVRSSKTFTVSDADIRERLLHWASTKEICCILISNKDSQSFSDKYQQFDFIAAINAPKTISGSETPFDELQKFSDKEKDYLFGYFTYDLKNKIENLSSSNADGLEFPEMFFFQPEFVITCVNDKLKIEYPEQYSVEIVDSLFKEIIEFNIEVNDLPAPVIKQRVERLEYLSTVKKIKQHIQRGDIYEMNYCMEFYAEAEISPAEIYWKLNSVSPMPFSAFFKNERHYAICASPERFIAKRGTKIISQPIKGTAKRGKSNQDDEEIKKQLQESEKEQSENVMIVDLVRNDLSRTAKKASVKVEELFGVYSFKQLHHMISTVISEMHDDIAFADVIKYAFPMGSMTGAPKIRAMELIDEYEKTKRGLFSGSIGYITPHQDFDFNVVIRTILYNAAEKYLSFMVGSAITANCNEEREYEECLLKAQAMLKIFERKKEPTSVND